MKRWMLAGLVFFFLLSQGKTFAAPCEFRAGVLFPEGTSWMKNIHKMEEEIKQKTNGECSFVIYTGGSQGDEPTMLQKMRLGQLNVMMSSGMGLNKIDTAIEVLENPGLYDISAGLTRAYQEVDYVHQKMLPVFQDRFRKKGYELVALASQGFMYVYTTKPVKTFDDIRKLKFELWSGLLMNQKLCEGFKLNCIPVNFPEILTNLQTGLLDVVYLNPMTLVALQWHTEVKYVVDMPLVHGIGGFIVTKSTWDKVSPAYQKVIAEAIQRYLPDIHAANRRDDQIVADSLLKQGIQNIAPQKEMMESFLSDSKAMQQKMVGDLYPQEILDQVLAHLKEFRTKNPLPDQKEVGNAKN